MGNQIRRILPAIALAVFGQSAIVGAAGAAVVSGEVTGGQALKNGGRFVTMDGSGSFTVGGNNINTPHLYAFNEVQDHTLTGDLILGGVTLAAGTTVSSHYVAFDPFHYIRQKGYVMFDKAVLAVASTVAELRMTDYLASPTVTYRGGDLRGLERNQDRVTVSGSRIDVDWKAWNPGDFVRVFTVGTAPVTVQPTAVEPAAVPLPAGGLLLIGALGGLAAARRRKRG